MPWVRVDDNFPDHPKVDGLSDLAFRLHVAALCYCNRLLTDGDIPKGKEKRLTPKTNVSSAVDELLEAGLWHDEGDRWRIHDYLDFQPDKAKVTAEREATAERQRRYRERKTKERSKGSDGTVHVLRSSGVTP